MVFGFHLKEITLQRRENKKKWFASCRCMWIASPCPWVNAQDVYELKIISQKDTKSGCCLSYAWLLCCFCLFWRKTHITVAQVYVRIVSRLYITLVATDEEEKTISNKIDNDNEIGERILRCYIQHIYFSCDVQRLLFIHGKPFICLLCDVPYCSIKVFIWLWCFI